VTENLIIGLRQRGCFR